MRNIYVLLHYHYHFYYFQLRLHRYLQHARDIQSDDMQFSYYTKAKQPRVFSDTLAKCI